MGDSLDVKQLLDAGIHYGHHTGRWNPKMKKYIYGKRNSLHIIDIKETIRGLLLAKKFLYQTVQEGNDIVLVGTKRQAQKCIKSTAERLEMHWVIDRWIGGTLTNFREIRKRVRRLDELEQMETDGTLDIYSKKEGSRLRRELRKVRRNLGGIRNMTKFPGAMVVIDPTREHIAVREAQKVNIPVIALIDTEADPSLVDIPIPGNDDAMRAIEIVVEELATAVEMGIKGRGTRVETGEEAKAERRRSRRPTTARADEIPEEVPYKTDAAPAPADATPAAEGSTPDTPAPETPAPASPPTEGDGEIAESPAPVAAPPADEPAPTDGNEAPVPAPEEAPAGENETPAPVPAPEVAPADESDAPSAGHETADADAGESGGEVPSGDTPADEEAIEKAASEETGTQ